MFEKHFISSLLTLELRQVFKEGNKVSKITPVGITVVIRDFINYLAQAVRG